MVEGLGFRAVRTFRMLWLKFRDWGLGFRV